MGFFNKNCLCWSFTCNSTALFFENLKHKGLWSCRVLSTGAKDQRCNTCMHLASLFLTVSLSLVCLLLYVSFQFWGNQEGRKVEEECAQQNWFSPILLWRFWVIAWYFLLGLEVRPLEEEPSVSGLWCINSVMSCQRVWRIPFWFCGFCRELLYGNNLPSEVVSLTTCKTKLGQIEKFCQLGGGPPLSLFLSWFSTALVTITESLSSFNRWPVYKEN